MTAYNVISPLLMQNGQPEDISIPKSNFDAIAAVVNGGLDDGNIAPGANIALSKIAANGTWGGVTFNQGNMTVPGYIHTVGDIYAQYNDNPVGIGDMGPAGQSGIKFYGDSSIYRTGVNALRTDGTFVIPNLQDRSEKGQPGGYAPLDGSGKVPASYIADISATYQLRSERGQALGYPTLDGGAKIPVGFIPDLSPTYQLLSLKGQANGYASLGSDGKVPSSQLPPGIDPSQLQLRSEKGQANGYAGLDASAKVPVAQLPDVSTTYQLTSQKGQASGYAGLNASGVVPAAQLDLTAYQALAAKAQANGYASLDSGGKVPLAQLPPVGADLIYDGDYASGPTYKDGEVVVYNNIAYLCTAPTTSPPTAWPGGPTGIPSNPVVAYGTSLPASPTDGMEAILVDSVTNPTYQWRFRYNAQSTSPYKWEFVGGAPFSSRRSAVSSAITSASYVSLGSGTPGVVVPRAGDYDWRLCCSSFNNTGGQTSLVTVAPSAGAAQDPFACVYVAPNNNYTVWLDREERIAGLAASAALDVYARVTGGSASFDRMYMAVTPVRVA